MFSQRRLICLQFLFSHLKAQLIQGQPNDLAIRWFSFAALPLFNAYQSHTETYRAAVISSFS